MEEWAANPQWWLSNGVATLMGIALTASLPSFYRRISAAFRAMMGRAKGRILVAYRARKAKRLRKIKAIRFDSLAINRQIATSAALLILFITTGVATIAAIINLPAEIQRSYAMTVVIGLVLAIPALLFEFAWLTSSSRLDDVLKSRKRIKRRRSGVY